MIPLQLSFQGLYSYREPQTINFEQLTASQLFGIFGPVGMWQVFGTRGHHVCALRPQRPVE